MTALHLIGAWVAVATVLTALIARAGFLRKQIREVQKVGPFGQQPRGDLSELGGLSQSNHNGGIAL